MNIVRRFLKLIDGTEGNMKVNRLQVLLEVYSAGEISLSDIHTRLGLHPAHVSKLVSTWMSFTYLKQPGPGYIETYPDPMHLNTKFAKITPAGKKYIKSLLAEDELV